MKEKTKYIETIGNVIFYGSFLYHDFSISTAFLIIVIFAQSIYYKSELKRKDEKREFLEMNYLRLKKDLTEKRKIICNNKNV